jgi:hypothetical protein
MAGEGFKLDNPCTHPIESFLPAAVRVYSLKMNLTQKQFSLTGGSLKNEIPISNLTDFRKLKPQPTTPADL